VWKVSTNNKISYFLDIIKTKVKLKRVILVSHKDTTNVENCVSLHKHTLYNYLNKFPEIYKDIREAKKT
jgi:hypothetical protein